MFDEKFLRPKSQDNTRRIKKLKTRTNTANDDDQRMLFPTILLLSTLPFALKLATADLGSFIYECLKVLLGKFLSRMIFHNNGYYTEVFLTRVF